MGINVLAQSKKEMAVARAVETLTKAMINADIPTLKKVTSDKLSYGHSGGLVENQTEFIDKFASNKSDFVTIDITEQNIIVSDNVATVRHILKASTNDNGTAGNVHLRILLIWQKQKGQWVLLARQAVKFI